MSKKDHSGLFKKGVSDPRRSNRQVRGRLYNSEGKLVSIPALAREYTSLALHTLVCITANRDPDSIILGASDLEILAGAIPETPISAGDRIKGAVALLERGHGRVPTSEDLLKIDNQSQPINSLSTDALLKLLEVQEVEEQ